MNLARKRRDRVVSMREAIDVLARHEVLPSEFRKRLDLLRQTRNTAVHRASDLKPGQLSNASAEIEVLYPELQALKQTFSDRR